MLDKFAANATHRVEQLLSRIGLDNCWFLCYIRGSSILAAVVRSFIEYVIGTIA
jgi:hypothetical protein